MANPVKAVKTSTEVGSGVKDTKAVADGLAGVLSNTYRLLIKSHMYHWNVEGPLFYSMHHLTEEQYTNLFEATDELAERIRALGHMTPMNVDTIVDGPEIGKAQPKLSAQEMAEDLAQDHEGLAQRLHALVELAEGESDPVTADMATARSAFHEKAAWMLRATAAE